MRKVIYGKITLISAIEVRQELARMSTPIRDPSKGADQSTVFNPVQTNALMALPHVDEMIMAMKRRDKAVAIASGRSALKVL
jgi:hypothetical protein